MLFFHGLRVLLLLCFLFFGYSFEGLYEVSSVNVIDVRDNKILVDYSSYSHGEIEVLEIHKPIYANIHEGDAISVRYPVNHPEKMYYVIEGEVGEIILGICFTIVGVIFAGYMFCMFTFIVVYGIIHIAHRNK